jgi:hypothetical protein
MKLKRLKKIRIDEIVFDIIWDKDEGGGSMNFPNHLMVIGTALGEISAFATLLHELKEIVNVTQNIRYTRPDTPKCYEFHYTHREHSDMCDRLAGILSEFIQ